MILGDDRSESQQSQQTQPPPPPPPPPPPMDAKNPGGPPLQPRSPHMSGPPSPYYQTQQSLYSHYPSLHPSPSRRSSPGRRFCKAFTLAILVWLVLGMFTRSVVELAEHTHRSLSYPAGPEGRDGDIERCLKGFDWSRDREHPPAEISPGYYEVESVFTLPVDADALYLLSRGRWSFGALDIQASDDVEDVIVKVTARYNDQKLIDAASVCLLTRGDNEHGLGIFTPKDWPEPRNNRRLSWGVEVLIPSGAVLPSFSTHLPIFPHHLGELDGSVFFHKLNLETSNAPIRVESIRAIDASIHTSNAPIGGRFNTSDSLVIKTSNSPIDAEVKLNNDPARNKATIAKLDTSNGHIELEATLVSSAKSGDEGRFDLSARTSNSPLKTKFTAAPADSTINLVAHTSNSPARVTLVDAYEGSFVAHTSIMPIKLNTLDDPEDPRGKGRKREVDINWRDSHRRSIEGSVRWAGGNRKTPLGSVDVHTSNSPLELAV